MKQRLYYTTAACSWEEALPIGNGRLGAMVFGDPIHERLALNEDTFWSGTDPSQPNPSAKAAMPEIKSLVMQGRLQEAQDRICSDVLCDWTSAYMPLGNLYLDSDAQQITDYRRVLELETAVHSSVFRADGVLHRREIFSSFPDQIIVLRESCDRPGSVHICLRGESLMEHRVCTEQDCLVMQVTAPAYTAPNYYPCDDPIRQGENTIQGFVYARILPEGGTLERTDRELRLRDADGYTLLISMATSYMGYGKPLCPETGRKRCEAYLAAGQSRSWEVLLNRHIEDYRKLYSRVNLQLTQEAEICTDQRIRRVEAGAKDDALLALIFQYGRYLLISSSRPGSQAANLQGIWNQDLRPAWSCNYTTNINVEMNYWGANTCNLSECEEPLIDLIGEIACSGEKTAEQMYGCRGWVCHHNVDLWRTTVPMGRDGFKQGFSPVRYGMWPMAGLWLCFHLWEHYLFTEDVEFLRNRAFPLMRSCGLFLVDWMTWDDSGKCFSVPSTSPENEFLADGKTFAVSRMSTMDISLIQDFCNAFACAVQILGVTEDLEGKISHIREHLPGYGVNQLGGVREWLPDHPEAEPHHRHLSPLYGLYPSSVLPKELNPACRKTLELRGDSGPGWSVVWKSILHSRLGDGDTARRLLMNLIHITTEKGVNYCEQGEYSGVYPNLFFAHPPFQIDANLGFLAAISEMLLQSQEEKIHLLPALPKEWRSGSVSGLRARGNVTVDIRWENGRLTSAVLRSEKEKKVSVVYGETVGFFRLLGGIPREIGASFPD